MTEILADTDEWATWRALMFSFIDNPLVQVRKNEDYEATIPPCLLCDAVYDYEPHSAGIGDHDNPDESMFQRYYHPSWLRNPLYLPVLTISNLSEALEIVHGNYERWIHVFKPNQAPWTADGGAREGADNFVWFEGDESTVFPLPVNLRHVIWDLNKYEGNVSLVLLCLFLAMPNLESVSVSALRCNEAVETLFASFPSPRPNVPCVWDVLSIPSGFTIAPKLQTLHFNHCHMSSSDMYFLGDCAIEHKVFPALRNVKHYYCFGMTYASIIGLSQAVNLSFDRWEISGNTCPQECVNPKNREVLFLSWNPFESS
jgi:hypothetical protein